MTVEVALVLSLVSVGVAVVGALAGGRRWSQKEGKIQGRQEATLEHIKSRVDEVWAGYRRTEEQMTQMERRILRLETESKHYPLQ